MGKILRTKSLTTAFEAIIVIIGLGITLTAAYIFKAPKLDDRVNIKIGSDEKIIRIAVNTWGGFAGGQYWNEGFKANVESRFYKDSKLYVDFVLIDDFTASREALKSGEVDMIWSTADLFPTDAPNLPGDVKIVFQSDWSRGGDAVVSRPGINTVADLKGKKVAVSLLTPSHTLLISLLEQSGMSLTDVKLVETANAMDAASMFKSGQVDAAIVWSPDDLDCLAAVKGSKILTSTNTATHIIADVLIAKEEFINSNKEALIALYDGWMKGAAELNNSEAARRKASKILAQNFEGVDENFCYTAIQNARLTTHGDNLNFFGLNYTYKGVTGESIWNKMTVKYSELGYVPKQMNWRVAHTSDIVKGSKLSLNGGQEAEKVKTFTAPTKQMEDTKITTAISSKSTTINFNSGSSVLSDEAKFIIDKEFAEIAKINTTARIRIVGNTDNTGSYNANVVLSKQRASAVANYLYSEYGISKNRMVIVGNGPKYAVEAGVNGASEEYRRTDFELIVE